MKQTHVLRLCTFVSLWLCITPHTAAQQTKCKADQIGNAFAIKVSASVFEQLSQTLKYELPTRFEIPEDELGLFPCANNDNSASLTPHNGVLIIEFTDLQMQLDSDNIALSFAITANGSANLDMEICALANKYCPAEFHSEDIQGSLIFSPQIEDCKLTYQISDVQLNIPPSSTSVSLDQCGFYDDIWNLAYNAFSQFILAFAESAIEDAVSDIVPSSLEPLSSQFFNDGIAGFGFGLSFSPQDVSISPQGLTTTFSAASRVLKQAGSCPANSFEPELPADGEDFPDFVDASVSIILSKNIMQNLMNTGWQSGWLCLDTRTLAVDLSDAIGLVLPDTDMHALIYATQPPEFLLPSDGNIESLALQQEQLHIDITLSFSNSETKQIAITTSVFLLGTIKIHQDLQALVISIQDYDMSELAIDYNDDNITISRQSLSTIIEELLLPLYIEHMPPLPASAAILQAAPAAFSLENIVFTRNHVLGAFDIQLRDRSDSIEPRTKLLQPIPTIIRPSHTIYFDSQDNHSKSAYIQHEIYIDEELFWGPQAGQTVTLYNIPTGTHNFAFFAVDLNGNVDSSAVGTQAIIDGQAPQIEWLERPYSFTTEDSAKLLFRFQDNISPRDKLDITYELSALDPNSNEYTLLETQPLGTLDELELIDLPDDQIVTLRLNVKDEAGNKTQERAAFGILAKPSFQGCNTSKSHPLMVFLVLGLVIFLPLPYSAQRRGHDD